MSPLGRVLGFNTIKIILGMLLVDIFIEVCTHAALYYREIYPRILFEQRHIGKMFSSIERFLNKLTYTPCVRNFFLVLVQKRFHGLEACWYGNVAILMLPVILKEC